MTAPSESPSIWNRVVIAILVTETAERMAYFGFRAILVLYFHNGLGLSESLSVSLFGGVSCGAYFSPLVGALLADSSWGRYHTILTFSTLYTIGLCFLTLGAYQVSSVGRSRNQEDPNTNPEHVEATDNLLYEKVATFLGLFLVCLGTGGIKPCVSAFGADQIALGESNERRKRNDTHSDHRKNSDDFEESMEQEQHVEELQLQSAQEDISRFFNSFYFCINLGALSSFAIIPIIRSNFGFGAAFLVPTIFMSTALLVFLSQRRQYKHRIHNLSQPPLSRVLRHCVSLLWSRRGYRQVPISARKENGRRGEESQDGIMTSIDLVIHEDAQQVLHLMPVMLLFPVFWMLYDQQGSVWTLQATRLNLHGLQPEQLQFLNPLQIMIFIPLFDQIVYPLMDHCGFDIKPLRRMEYGMGFAVLSFLTSALLEHFIQTRPTNSVSLGWQIPQITILTVSEIFLNITGLEFAYSQAPGNMQALILALYLFMTAIGDGLAAFLFATFFSHLSTAVTMIICAICMTANTLLFRFVARRWKPYQDHRVILEEVDEGLQLGIVNPKDMS
ncbi:POT family protein [Nitzschia inconspicua]|uniref:POT family protein n=1 Tax=Nitzschia inconspicua TaxID=303405 RepID=A0A9K3KZS6_9STRA|nr:POT family protein [Nitzschia inconspicua]